MRIVTFFLMFSILLITGCKKEEVNNLDLQTNAKGEHFRSIVSSNKVKVIVVVESHFGGTDTESYHNKHAFPGNNFIRVWSEFPPGNSVYAEKHFNLEKVVWYNVEQREYNNEEVMALLIQFEAYRKK